MPDVAIALTVELSYIGKFGDIERTAGQSRSGPSASAACAQRRPRVRDVGWPRACAGSGSRTRDPDQAMLADDVRLSLEGTSFVHARARTPVRLRILGHHAI